MPDPVSFDPLGSAQLVELLFGPLGDLSAGRSVSLSTLGSVGGPLVQPANGDSFGMLVAPPTPPVPQEHAGESGAAFTMRGQGRGRGTVLEAELPLLQRSTGGPLPMGCRRGMGLSLKGRVGQGMGWSLGTRERIGG